MSIIFADESPFTYIVDSLTNTTISKQSIHCNTEMLVISLFSTEVFNVVHALLQRLRYAHV